MTICNVTAIALVGVGKGAGTDFRYGTVHRAPCPRVRDQSRSRKGAWARRTRGFRNMNGSAIAFAHPTMLGPRWMNGTHRSFWQNETNATVRHEISTHYCLFCAQARIARIEASAKSGSDRASGVIVPGCRFAPIRAKDYRQRNILRSPPRRWGPRLGDVRVLRPGSPRLSSRRRGFAGTNGEEVLRSRIAAQHCSVGQDEPTGTISNAPPRT